MKLAPGLHLIGNDLIAAYLIVTDAGVTVIDAALRGHWRELVSELESVGLTPADVRGLILTHGDTDHLGFAERLRREHAVPVFVHEADAGRARGEKPPTTPPDPRRLGAAIQFMAYALSRGGARTEYLREVVEVSDGDVLDLPGGPRVIGMPGHSPGSIAIHAPEVDALFVGDAFTTRHVLTGRTGAQPAPFTDDHRQARESLSRLEGVHAHWVLPGHGAPWTAGVRTLLDELRSDPSAV